ncbi:MAG: peptidase M50 [Candidatus Parvarchaeum acidiphilum ARMAN-4]|uniref:Peptidase M50 n=1 Tax=Candidatus Parvarchaeum acidiphilum ARMAN-4 TaxID=662760 RepID=D2EFS7_PARA4|nr:MAG: peptidase M50 [Candidatus Parvarchaeum acidiphilum ARMAN-4]
MSVLSVLLANGDNLLLTILILLAFGLFVVIERKRFDVEGKVVFLYKTKIGLKLMKRMAKFKRIINIYSTIGVFVALAGIAFVLYLFIPYLYLMITSPTTTFPAVAPLFPVSISVGGIPVLIGVPILYILIAIILLAALHEASHGVLALSKNIKIKSTGFGFLFGVLPLAFVEPDEKKIVKAKRIDRLRIFSAGAFTNVVLGFIFLGAYLALSHFIVSANMISYSPYYLDVSTVVNSSPASIVSLPVNSTVSEINGHKFYSEQEALSDLNVKPGQYVNFTLTNGKVYSMRTTYNSSINNTYHSYIGVGGFFSLAKPPAFIIEPISVTAFPNNTFSSQSLYWIDGLFLWLWVISFSLAIVNILPLSYLVDGGKIFFDALGYVVKNEKKALAILNTVAFLFILLLVLLSPIGSIIFASLR